MKKILYVFVLCLLSSIPICSQAQGANNNWYFGRKTGLNFSGPNPVFLQQSGRVYEGSASVSDAAGNLLFSVGDTLWDRNGNYMPNGTGLSGNYNGSSARGVAIVPAPGAPGKYYVFMTDGLESMLYNAYYSVLDMSLNGGLGDVVPGQKNIMIDTGIAEGVIVMPAAGCEDYWILFHRRLSADYLAYKLDATGVLPTPVISTGPVFIANNPYGQQAYLQSNNTFAQVLRSNGFLELSSFNNGTGQLSNFQVIDPAPHIPFYSIFSPDDSKLYFTDNSGIYQVNLSLLPNITAVQNSMYTVDTGIYSGSRLGPDNKIYTMRFLHGHIARINNPNAAGAACNIDPSNLTLPPYAFFNPANPLAIFSELGNPIVLLTPSDTTYSSNDTGICFSNSLTLSGAAGRDNYQWSTGGTSRQETVDQDGAYWLYSTQGCHARIDTFHVTITNFSIDLGPDTVICPGRSLWLNAIAPGATYQWQDSSSFATYVVTEPGSYNVTVNLNDCILQDSIQVGLIHPELNIREHDTLICAGTPLVLHADAFPSSTFQWSNGGTADSSQVQGMGSYTVTATNICGIFSDSVRISIEDCYCNAFVPNAFSPNGDGRNDLLEVKLHCPGSTDYIFAIYNRYGQRVFETRSIQEGWDGRYHGGVADAGAYYYYLRYKNERSEVVKKKGDVTLIR